MAAPNNLEYDLATGGRGDRDAIVEELLCTHHRRRGRDRRQQQRRRRAADHRGAGARPRGDRLARRAGRDRRRLPHARRDGQRRRALVEVGTTNRTHPHDYERAISARTALLMKVHTSNYAVQGFTAAVDEADARRASRTRAACRWPPTSAAARWSTWPHYGLPREPLPQEMLAAGCDVVTFRGDKLLGGPQAGLIVGRKAADRPHPQVPAEARAARRASCRWPRSRRRCGSTCGPSGWRSDLPTLRLLTRPADAIRALAERAAAAGRRGGRRRASRSRSSTLLGQIGSRLAAGRAPALGRPGARAGRHGEDAAAARALDALAARACARCRCR